MTAAAVLAPSPARAQDDPPQPRFPRTVDDGGPALLPGATQDVLATAPTLEGAQATQGQVAFQSYRDGNWEVYLGSSDTLAVGRLTAHSAADVEPRLSPDMSRIVFSSKRTGNYELFRIDASGSGLMQLTNDAATDSAAAWSPDGQRIAFQSNRTGNSDIFVMNADGSGLVRLTSNADYDGEPAWSPDGNEIAFVSRRSTGDLDYFLYVMNADGSGQRLLAPVPYSSRPAWSLRGRRILFDGLGGSGWQNLYTYDFATGTTRPAGPVPGANTDDLAGSWGGNDTIYFTRIYYVQYNGQWYISTMQVLTGTDGTSVGQRILFGNVDGFPTWSNPDHLPPSSFGYVSTPFVRRGTSPYAWGFVLDKAAGGLEAQHRADGGTWTNGDYGCVKYNEITWRCHLYPADGTQYDVRVRGVDAYENREDWSNSPQNWMQVQVYQRLIQGAVRDQIGAGVLNVPIQGLTVLDPAVSTDEYGTFSAHQANSNAFVISASVGGSTASVSSDAIGGYTSNDVWAELRPAPAGNVLVNPDFSNPDVAWTDLAGTPEWWTAAAAQADSPVLHFSWQSEPISPWANVTSPIVAFSGTTEIYLATVAYNAVELRICPLGQSCIAESLGSGIPRELFAAPDGSVGIVLGDYTANRTFRTRSPGGVWSVSETLPDFGSSLGDQLLRDHQGRWHLLWIDGSSMVKISHRNDAGVWSAPTNTQVYANGWKAALDASDTLHLVGCTSSGVSEINWSAASGLSLPVTVSTEICSGQHVGTHLDGDGQVYVLWALSNHEVRYSRRSAAGVWGPVVPLAGKALAGYYSVVGPNGRPLVAVNESAGEWVFYEATADGSGWTLLPWRFTVPTTSTNLQIRGFNGANPSVTLYDLAMSTLTRYRLTGQNSTIGAQQVVTIPAGIHQPLLSTYYRFTNGEAGDELSLGIQASDEATPTYLPLATGLGWQRAWRDVSAWAGKTVTVTIQLIDGPGASTPSADINEIYLGAYTTPSVTALDPNAFATPTGSFTITGTNFIATPTVTVGGIAATVTLVDSQHLTVAVPPTLLPGAHRVVVTNPEGYTAIAPQAVIVGHALTLPVLMRWMPPDRP